MVDKNYQETYDSLVEGNHNACNAIKYRNLSRGYQSFGNPDSALSYAGISRNYAEKAVKDDDIFRRELFASLGQVARVEICVSGGSPTYSGTYFHSALVEDMEEIDLGNDGLDQYEMIFWPTMAAARFSGDVKERLHGTALGFGGMIASAIYFESKHLVKYPNREKGLAWRLGKKVEYIGRNALAVGANIFKSHGLAKLAVK